MKNPSNDFLDAVLKELEEIQAKDILVLHVRDQTTVTDDMVICTGRSSRHVKSIAEYLIEKMKALGYSDLSHSGLAQGDWALIDFGDIIVHIMQADSRAFYNLEGLWQAD